MRFPIMDSIGRVDPFVRRATKQGYDLEEYKNLGRPKMYMHNYNASYTLPTRTIPLMDWVQVTAQGPVRIPGWLDL